MIRRHKMSFVLVTVVFLTGFIGSIFMSMDSVNKKMRKNCFNQLNSTAEDLAYNLKKDIGLDQAVLNAIAENLASHDSLNDQKVVKAINSYHSEYSYISYVEYLDSNNRLLSQDGSIKDASGVLNYQDEAAKGAFITGKEKGIFNPDHYYVRSVTPVTKDGETIGVLYGIVMLEEFSEKYKTTIYDGNAYVYLEDGATGDFFLIPGINLLEI